MGGQNANITRLNLPHYKENGVRLAVGGLGKVAQGYPHLPRLVGGRGALSQRRWELLEKQIVKGVEG